MRIGRQMMMGAGFLALLAAVTAPAAGQETYLEAGQPHTRAPVGATEAWEKPGVMKALSFSIDYTLVSDYIFRGINFSEYAGEGRELPNHQMGVGFAIDTAELGVPIGTFSATFWFQWWAGLNDTAAGFDTGSHLQEVNYVAAWSYDIPDTPVAVELGWIAYQFPYVGGDDPQWTHEGYVTLAFDDSCLFGDPVLNPYMSYYLDMDDIRGSWLEFGIRHDLALSDMGMAEMPVLEHVTVSPSLVLGVDHRYHDKLERAEGGRTGIGTRLANLTYGLEVGLDVSGLLDLPEKYGAVGLAGFLNFSQRLSSHSPLVGDELYGGMTASYSW